MCRSLFFSKVFKKIKTVVQACEFLVNFAKSLRAHLFYRTLPGDCFSINFALILIVTQEFCSFKSKCFVMKEIMLITKKTSTSNESCFHFK